MRRLCWGGLSLIVLSLAVGAASAQGPVSGWLPSWFGGKPAPRPEDKALSLKDTARQVPDRKAELDVLMNALLRRTAVCIELQKVAEATNDDALREEALRLNDLAAQLYKERSEKLLGAQAVGLGEEPRIDTGLDETRDLLLESVQRDRRKLPAPRGVPNMGGDR